MKTSQCRSHLQHCPPLCKTLSVAFGAVSPQHRLRFPGGERVLRLRGRLVTHWHTIHHHDFYIKGLDTFGRNRSAPSPQTHLADLALGPTQAANVVLRSSHCPPWVAACWFDDRMQGPVIPEHAIQPASSRKSLAASRTSEASTSTLDHPIVSRSLCPILQCHGLGRFAVTDAISSLVARHWAADNSVFGELGRTRRLGSDVLILTSPRES